MNLLADKGGIKRGRSLRKETTSFNHKTRLANLNAIASVPLEDCAFIRARGKFGVFGKITRLITRFGGFKTLCATFELGI